MAWADLLRLLCALIAAPLMFVCVTAFYHCATIGQRMRFLSLALIALVVTASQIDLWGEPVHWRTPMLTIGLAVGLAGSVLFLRETRHDLED